MPSSFPDPSRRPASVAAVLLCLALGACNSSQRGPSEACYEPESFAQPFNRPADALLEEEVKASFATYNPTASTVFPDYRLNVGDVLEVIFHVRTGVTLERYRLKVQDRVSIQFPFHRDLNQDITVQSDGTIQAMLVGNVTVIGRGSPGLGQNHFRQRGGTWERFDPQARPSPDSDSKSGAGEWKPVPFVIIRAPDGTGWLKRDPDTGEEMPLEDYLGQFRTLRATPAYIIDVQRPGDDRYDRYDRYQYDHAAQQWGTLPTIVEQVGLTASELEKVLIKAYAKYVRDPVLTVQLQQSNTKIAELKVAITTAPRGQSRLMPVKPDGTVDLPFVGQLLAYGKTVQQLRFDAEAAYAQVDLPEISVTVQIYEWAPQKVFVMGEVHAPGMQQAATPVTLLQAISTAGGANPRAELSQVMVIRRKGLPVPEATIMDLRSLLAEREPKKAGHVPDFANLRYDFYLADGDVVFVPSSMLAQTGDWVDMVFGRIVRNVLPYGFYTSLNFGYELHNEPNVNVNGDRRGLRNMNVNVGP